MSDNQYFAAKEPKDTAGILLDRANNWFHQNTQNGYLDKIRMMWAAYHGAYFTNWSDSHSINFSGEQGELVQLAVNHVRNLAQHMINMITATRPALQARATNTDQKSLIQTNLANGLLDYYMRDKRLEDYFKKAVEYAIVLGSGYLKFEWNSMIGQDYEYDEETGETIKEGDVQFSNLSPFDVVFDIQREDDQHDWILCRSFKSRYDFIAKYPEYEQKILGLPSKSDLEAYYLDNTMFSDTDLIPVYEFYHKKTEAMPEGRYLLFLDGDLTLLDSPMPYRDLPVYKITPATILGTPLGYSPLFDILPIQDSINSLYSTILTNQNAFGVQNLLVPRGSDVSISDLSGGLKVIEANTQYGQIQPLNLTNTPREVFDFVKMLESSIEVISGINSVTRGQPEANLKSGNAMALIQSMALQYISGLQHSYVRMIEESGTGLVNILKDHATIPRLASIVGKNKQTYIKDFTGADLTNIDRVIVDIGNPLANTTAGRVEMAEQMLQMGVIKTPEQYFQVIKTGRLDIMTENIDSELILVKDENERMVEGKDVIAIFTDEHLIHIKEHRAVLSNSTYRFMPEMVQRVQEHIQEHINLLRQTDPDLLSILGQQPLGPAGGSPISPIPNPNVPDQSMQGPNLPPMPPMEQMQGTPAPAQPPAPFENAPVLAQDLLPE